MDDQIGFILCLIGKNCELNVDDCAQVTCENGGKCKDMLNNFSCDCHPGFTGVRCTENIDECKSQPCQNGGTCIDGVASYRCQCTKKWAGKYFNVFVMLRRCI